MCIYRACSPEVVIPIIPVSSERLFLSRLVGNIRSDAAATVYFLSDCYYLRAAFISLESLETSTTVGEGTNK